MPKGRFTKAEVERAIAAVKASDLPVGGVEIRKDGTIVVMTAVDKQFQAVETEGPEPW